MHFRHISSSGQTAEREKLPGDMHYASFPSGSTVNVRSLGLRSNFAVLKVRASCCGCAGRCTASSEHSCGAAAAAAKPVAQSTFRAVEVAWARDDQRAKHPQVPAALRQSHDQHTTSTQSHIGCPDRPHTDRRVQTHRAGPVDSASALDASNAVAWHDSCSNSSPLSHTSTGGHSLVRV